MTGERHHPMDDAIRWRALARQLMDSDATAEQVRWACRSATICEEHSARLLREYLEAWGPAGLITQH